MTTHIIPLEHISIFNGSRVTNVVDPDTGKKRTHGLGAVGDPITPYLDHRAEGYYLEIFPGSAAPVVHEIDLRGPRLASGKFPSKRVPWSALGADDIDPFADWKN
ncbi:hypothetical protein I6E68_05960 [Salinibacterium sp. NSLL150]|uniref:hypothetical protein n=1 Tax=unclassified Salinibacterium TaxID=2632331 RepID=UPI0018CFD8C5|nr:MULTISPECIES: hypothetical protein [unclassified Salinibacterium]MBH0098685.1 hypothetical protein [Salinibacterium sp. NSLL35]MBH0101440.1 hypothetical protein [Salinibacterium sp. NSLL150]MBH0104199.1 hypothetical protein [Salinibacterium sp. NSLL16]MBH0106960.1 hypothetical protein [Salinibacterium sp. NSLL17]